MGCQHSLSPANLAKVDESALKRSGRVYSPAGASLGGLICWLAAPQQGAAKTRRKWLNSSACDPSVFSLIHFCCLRLLENHVHVARNTV
jgi:alpha-beta hydrolase superfamily lysophospholipase